MKVKFDVDRYPGSILVVLTIHEAGYVAQGIEAIIEDLQAQLVFAFKQMAEELAAQYPDAAQRGIEARKGADNG